MNRTHIWLLCAALSALQFVAPNVEAVVTNKVLLSPAGWVDLGPGPMILTPSGNVVFAVGDATPTIPLRQGFSLPIPKNQTLNTTSHVWAMSADTYSTWVFTSPIVGKGGNTNCAQSTNYLARTTGGNEGGNAVNIITLICGLVTDGVINGPMTGATGGCGTHFDGLYLTAQQNAADAKLNLCGTGYTLIPSTATFVAYQGFSHFPDGAMDTQFNPYTALTPNYNQNSVDIGIWAYDTNDASSYFGQNSPGGNIVLTIGTGYFTCYVNNGTGPLGTSANFGFYACDRPDASTDVDYFNGVLLRSAPSTSLTVDNLTFRVGGVTAAGWSTQRTISEANFGGTLGTPLQINLYNRLRTYMTAIGVP